MHPVLRFYEDIIQGGVSGVALPARPRMIFVLHGALTIGGRTYRDGEAYGGSDAATLAAGADGVACWRWDLAPAGAPGSPLAGLGIRCEERLSAILETAPKGDLLLRGDSVAFPPGGCAFLHRHYGPGIRCLIEGGIRIDSAGCSTSYGPGSPWYENGVDPVFAQAAADRPTRFIRVMVLPRDLLGKSSFIFVNEEDKAKPRVQQYRIFVDRPIELAPAGG